MIREELQNNPDEIPYAVRNASTTVNWWRQRQAVIDLKVKLDKTVIPHAVG